MIWQGMQEAAERPGIWITGCITIRELGHVVVGYWHSFAAFAGCVETRPTKEPKTE